MKYSIIEYVSRCIIFDNKNMRKSLFNEILILHKHERATRQLSLVYFENKKNAVYNAKILHKGTN